MIWLFWLIGFLFWMKILIKGTTGVICSSYAVLNNIYSRLLQKQSSESVYKKMFLKISQNPQENTYAGVPF